MPNHAKRPQMDSGRSLAIIHDDADNFYDMIESLGSGQFGEVFQAQHKQTGKIVAVKFIDRKQTGANIDSVTAQEIEVMLRIDHITLVTLYEIYQTDTEIQLVMELLQGGDLFDRIKSQKKFAEEHTKEMMRQICLGVKYLHDRKIIHRDLKPENILLVHPEGSNVSGPKKWAIKVADFGRSKLFPEEAPEMHTQTRCGTPGYAAPEVLLRQAYDERIDCWGCGILAYIMLSGFPPFPLNMASDSVQKVTKAQFKFPARHWINISEEAKDFICKMLVADSGKRMSMEEALNHPWFKPEGSKDAPAAAPVRPTRVPVAKPKPVAALQAQPAISQLAGGSGSGLGVQKDEAPREQAQGATELNLKRANSSVKNQACCVIA